MIIGPSVESPIGICFMPSPDDKVVKNRVHLDLNPGAFATAEERALEIQPARWRSARRSSTSDSVATRAGRFSPIPKGTSSASCGRRPTSSAEP